MSAVTCGLSGPTSAEPLYHMAHCISHANHFLVAVLLWALYIGCRVNIALLFGLRQLDALHFGVSAQLVKFQSGAGPILVSQSAVAGLHLCTLAPLLEVGCLGSFSAHTIRHRDMCTCGLCDIPTAAYSLPQFWLGCLL